MIIYKDLNGNVVSVDNPVEGTEAIEIDKDDEMYDYYSLCSNHIHVQSDNTAVYSIIPPSAEKLATIKLRSELSSVTDAFNILLGVND